MTIPNLPYNDPLFIVWRKGDSLDPYIERVNQSHKIVNNRIILDYIPDQFAKVIITGYNETDDAPTLATQFQVNYSTGVITFYSSENGKTVLVTYRDRGIIQYPAERIYAHDPADSNILTNIQTIIDNANAGVAALAQLNAAVDNANSFDWKGTWSNATAYVVNNMVYYSGSSYICIQNNTNIVPTNVSYWQVFALAASNLNATLSADPVTDLEAATKRYVDNSVGNQSAIINRKISHSGVLDFVATPNTTLSNADGTAKAGQIQVITTNNAIQNYFSTHANTITLTDMDAIINGYIVKVKETSSFGEGTSGLGGAKIQLSNPPGSNDRYDLVFLETWFDPADGSSQKNMRYRFRVVDGVDFSTYPEGLGTQTDNANSAVTAQGALGAPVAWAGDNRDGFRWAGYTINTNISYLKQFRGDYGLYIAGDGTGTYKTKFGTVDGYVYAIPLFKIYRRNNANYNANTNPNGGHNIINMTVQTDVQVGTTSVLFTLLGGATVPVIGKVLLDGNMNYAATITSVTDNGNGTYTCGTTAFTSAYGANYALFRWRNDRPDQKYSNIVYFEDIDDLRHKVYLADVPYQNIILDNFEKLIKASLHTNKKVTPIRNYIGLPELSCTSTTALLLRYNNSVNGIAGAGQDAVVGTQIGSALTYKNGVNGQSAYFNGTTAYEYRYPLSGISLTSGTVECSVMRDVNNTVIRGIWLLANSTNATERKIALTIGTDGLINVIIYNDSNNQVAMLSGSTNIFRNWEVGNVWRTIRFDWDNTGMFLYLDNVLIASTASLLSSYMTLPLQYIVVGASSDGSTYAYKWLGRIDELRVSNIRLSTSTFQVPSGYNYTNGDRIIDGPDGTRTYWTDDAATPTGLTDVPRQFNYNAYAECEHPINTKIRHYYQNAITGGFSVSAIMGESNIPSNRLDQSAEFFRVKANEVANGILTTFTFTKPTNAATGYFLINQSSYASFVETNGAGTSVTPSSASIDVNGNLTIVYSSAPSGGNFPTVVYTIGDKHFHLVSNTKGFVVHNWAKYTFNGDGVATQFDISNNNRVINVVNHVRVNNVIQNTTGVYTVGNDGGANANHRITFSVAPTNGATIEVFVEEVLVPSTSEAGFWIKYNHVPYQGVSIGGETIEYLIGPLNGIFATSNGTGYNEASLYNGTPGLSTMLPMPTVTGTLVLDSNLKSDSVALAGITFGWSNSKFIFSPDMHTFNAVPRVSSATLSSTGRAKRGSISVLSARESIPLTSAIPHLSGSISLVKYKNQLYLFIQNQYSTNTQVSDSGNVVASDLFKVEGLPFLK